MGGGEATHGKPDQYAPQRRRRRERSGAERSGAGVELKWGRVREELKAGWKDERAGLCTTLRLKETVKHAHPTWKL